MERIVVDHEHVVGADYSGLALDQFSAEGSTFENCRFDRTKLGHAALGAGTEQSYYLGCSFDRASFAALGGFARFTGCTFRNVRFSQINADYLEFIDCSFTGRITGLELQGAPSTPQDRFDIVLSVLARQGRPEPSGYRELVFREHNEIRGNDFTGAELIKVWFRRGVDLSAQKLPAGDDYVYLPDAETAVLHALARLEHNQAEEAVRAKSFLQDMLEREIGAGQAQLLLRPKDFERRKVVPPEVLLAASLLRDVAAGARS
ncbi:hypothetical protein FB565_007185 [Actinoplanes lutulentus]|uniref:Pentapeptide repeat protein n=1 Tax=Actinoplanes lutulentus TaxID=1287878 RepID=A0A327ZBR7_9ACTN|nr:pentapeptide repeat-containing protein [Actinoplanes lutulentus]MBB2947417.1 hypothetical protein [Actinoplanes lutulentus]RAK36690.1 hypothetical protein B0I29_108280 [Actinoplanes lutulentus]